MRRDDGKYFFSSSHSLIQKIQEINFCIYYEFLCIMYVPGMYVCTGIICIRTYRMHLQVVYQVCIQCTEGTQVDELVAC